MREKYIPARKKVDEAPRGVILKKEFDPESWKPITELGRKVKAGDIKSIDEILDRGMRILEPEIIDFLVPNLEQDVLFVCQSKGDNACARESSKKCQAQSYQGSQRLRVMGMRMRRASFYSC